MPPLGSAYLRGEKLRARDDPRRGCVDACAEVLTPIALTNWGRRAHIAKSIYSSGIDWPSLKGDRAPAYKQVPLDPKYGNLTVSALGSPTSGHRVGFVPMVLLVAPRRWYFATIVSPDPWQLSLTVTFVCPSTAVTMILAPHHLL